MHYPLAVDRVRELWQLLCEGYVNPTNISRICGLSEETVIRFHCLALAGRVNQLKEG